MKWSRAWLALAAIATLGTRCASRSRHGPAANAESRPVVAVVADASADGGDANGIPADANAEGTDANPATARGREPAHAMSYRYADWLTRPERDAEEQPERMLDALGIRPGMSVADVGAGIGYHAWRIARRVGRTGQVFATDIQPEMLDMLRRNMARRRVTNVTAVLSGDASTGLPDASVDLVLMVDVYHELSEPEVYLRALRRALRPGGRLALVEFRAEDPNVPVRPEHRMTVDQVVRELSAQGWRLVQREEFLPIQHILVFE